MIIASMSQFHVYLYRGDNARLALCLKCESASRRFQPGEGPIVGAFSVILQLHRLIDLRH